MPSNLPPGVTQESIDFNEFCDDFARWKRTKYECEELEQYTTLTTVEELIESYTKKLQKLQSLHRSLTGRDFKPFI